jgi:hypothetical protein
MASIQKLLDRRSDGSIWSCDSDNVTAAACSAIEPDGLRIHKNITQISTKQLLLPHIIRLLSSGDTGFGLRAVLLTFRGFTVSSLP